MEIFPICPLEQSHDILIEQDCWACGLIASLYLIATETTDSGNPAIEAMCSLDDNLGYGERGEQSD